MYTGDAMGTVNRLAMPACAMLLAAMTLSLLAGCQSSSVKVDGGLQLLGSRRVKVGEVFTISQPFDAKTGAEWRLTEYDSAFIAPQGSPRLEGGTGGSYTRVVPFIAKSPGDTQLVFQRRNRTPLKYGELLPPPEHKNIKIKIVE